MGSKESDRYVCFLKNRLWEKRFSKNNSKSKDILFISFSNECRVPFVLEIRNKRKVQCNIKLAPWSTYLFHDWLCLLSYSLCTLSVQWPISWRTLQPNLLQWWSKTEVDWYTFIQIFIPQDAIGRTGPLVSLVLLLQRMWDLLHVSVKNQLKRVLVL